MKRITLLHLYITTTIIVVGCATPPKKVTLNDICSQNEEIQLEHGDKICFEAYLSLPEFVLIGQSCEVYAYSNENSPDKRIKFSIIVGEKPNQIHRLDERYSNSDLKILTNNGEIVGFFEKVILTGKFIKLNDGYRGFDFEKIDLP